MRPPQKSRVILGATCFSDASAALEIALHVAARIGGELCGIMIEDEAILHFADLPAARTFSREGHPLCRPGAARMQAAFRHDAARFRQSLSQEAAHRAVGWSFALRKGRLPAILSEEARAGDLVLLGGEPAPRDPGEVVLLAGPDWDMELLDLSVGLAAAFRSRLRVLHPVRGARLPAGIAVPVIVEDIGETGALALCLSRLGSATLLVADMADASGAISCFFENARFGRLLRSRPDAAAP